MILSTTNGHTVEDLAKAHESLIRECKNSRYARL